MIKINPESGWGENLEDESKEEIDRDQTPEEIIGAFRAAILNAQDVILTYKKPDDTATICRATPLKDGNSFLMFEIEGQIKEIILPNVLEIRIIENKE